MICLTLYLHPAEEYVVLDALRSFQEISGFTLTRCEGHGSEEFLDGGTPAADLVVGFVPRLRIEVVMEAGALDRLLEQIQAGLGPGSRGHFAVTPVLRSGPLNTVNGAGENDASEESSP